MQRLLLFFTTLTMLTVQTVSARPTADLDENGQPRVAVIFSASYGGGHNSSAEAIKAELLKKYPNMKVEILYAENYLPLANRFPAVAQASTGFFNWVYQRVPQLYDPVYEATIKTADGKTTAADIPNPFFSQRRVLEDLKRIKPDVIYSTFHILTSKLIWLREHGQLNPEIPIAWLDTDFVQRHFYNLHSIGVDLTFMAHPALTQGRVDRGVPSEKMATTGLFINPFVFEPFSAEQRRSFMLEAMSIPDRAKSKNPQDSTEIWINGEMQAISDPKVKLDPEAMTVTIASGRAGVGDYPTIIDGLIREARQRNKKIQIIAVCGDNDKNYANVIKLYKRMAKQGDVSDVTVVASHLVDNQKLMKLVRSSQLFIGKSGSQSPFEAAIMDVPRVLIDIIGGQERWTANFFKGLGLAEVIPAHEQKSLAERAFAYLEDPARMQQRREADQVIRDSYDLSPIPRFFEQAIENRSSKPSVVPAGHPDELDDAGFCELMFY